MIISYNSFRTRGNSNNKSHRSFLSKLNWSWENLEIVIHPTSSREKILQWVEVPQSGVVLIYLPTET